MLRRAIASCHRPLLVATVVLFALLGRVRANAAQCGKPAIEPSIFSDKRILGGEASVAGSWPWQARIGERVAGGISFFCGGAVLNPLFILTAGHCFPGNNLVAKKYVVRVAEHNMTGPESLERDYGVVMIVRHPNYTSIGSPANDLTLLRLAYPITFTDHISSVCLPEPASDPDPGSQCVVTGWGRFMDEFGPQVETNASSGNDTEYTSTSTASSSRTSTTTLGPTTTIQDTSTTPASSTSTIQLTSADPVASDKPPTPQMMSERKQGAAYAVASAGRKNSSRPTSRSTRPATRRRRPMTLFHLAASLLKPRKPLRAMKRMPLIKSHSDVLQQVAVTIMDRPECNAIWKPLLRPTMLCTHNKAGDPQREPCKGDSGGPMVCKSGTGPDATWRIEGIISFGAGCGARKPAIYTRVGSYVKWIQNVAKYPATIPLATLMSLAAAANGHPSPNFDAPNFANTDFANIKP